MALKSLHESLNGDSQVSHISTVEVRSTPAPVPRELPRLSIDSLKKNRRMRVIVGMGVAAVALGIVGGLVSPGQVSSQSEQTLPNASSAEQGHANGPVAPEMSALPSQVAQVPLKPAKHFIVNALPFKGRELGTYSITNETLTADVRNIRHDIIIKTASLVFTTSGVELQIAHTDGLTDKESNTVMEEIAVNVDSLGYGATLDKLNIHLRTITPGDILKENKEYTIGCATVPVWGCPHGPSAPKEALLSVKEQKQLLMSAELLIAQNILQQCGPIEDLVERQKIQSDIENQVTNQGFDPRLAPISFTNSKGTPASKIPNYIYDLQKQLVKQGAFGSQKKLATLFSTDPNGVFLKATCSPNQLTSNSP